MDTLNDFRMKQKKYMPIFPKASGKPTIYIEGYPCEDDEPMAETDFHAEQITTLSDQLKRYFAINDLVHIAVDSFIYYSEGDITKCVAPDIHIVFGVEKYPLRRSFYTWAEGAVPVAVFEFLSDSTAHLDREKKVDLYMTEIGVQEYFIHQPEMEKPAEFRGWQRSTSGNYTEIEPDAEGGLFSNALNFWFRWKDDLKTHVRLLRPYLPDGTPITTSMEEQQLHKQEKQLREQEQQLREQEKHLREEAEAMAAEEAERRQAAEAFAKQETERRQELEAELEQLRKQVGDSQDRTP
ncbi:MAG: Uma2 family endonuclease [Candidatus Poribacteria bacterium]|nr:Uma2 family endonuclease [Candidatus Poribacteria bacterium]